MNIYKLKEMSKEQKRKIMKRAEEDITANMRLAKEISDDILKNGDKALLFYTEKFDKVKLDSIKVTKGEIEDAYSKTDEKVKDAIKYAAENIRKFHEKQMPEEMWFANIDDGLMVGEKTAPLDDVCLYVPGGKGSFPSVLLMLGVPAVVAGVKKIVAVTPPNEKGGVDGGILCAAKIIGVGEIYKCGGIQAVAAAAYGTQTVPKCRKIIGPGNSYVTAAKRALSSEIDVGLPAGPSESIILADEKADPFNAALDLMIEAEHGPDSAALLVTHSEELAREAAAIAEKQLAKLSDRRRSFAETVFSGYGGIIITESLEESIDFVNEYAPEHMEIMTENPFDVLPKIRNAGEILLGGHTPITLCNFLLGPNAILPTGGFAKTHSAVTVNDFLKRSSVGYASKEGFLNVREKAKIFADIEGFETHALAVSERRI